MKRLKGYFIFSTAIDNFEDNKKTGVGKKIAAQVAELSKDFDVVVELNHTGILKQNVWQKIRRRLPYTAINIRWKASDKYKDADFIYFRKDVVDYSVYRFLYDIKKNNPSCKVIFEVATFPYDKEVLRRPADIFFYIKDILNRNRLKKCVDRIVTLSEHKQIFGIKTIRTINGLDFSKVCVRDCIENTEDINMIAVTSFAKWHGEDRLISGFDNYYNHKKGTRNIVLHLVGKGEKYEVLMDQVKAKGLEDHVIFYGYKTGEELNEIYNKADVAINSLALHRLGLKSASTLKSREYGAKGLPIVSGSSIDYLPHNYQYLLKVPSNDSPLDVQEIIDFYDKIYTCYSKQEIALNIRAFAEQRCDMKLTMKTIIDYIKEES